MELRRNATCGQLPDISPKESGSPETARRFVAQLRQQCEKLASLPGTLGRARPELYPDLRSSPFKGYVIFFRYVDDSLEIVNILEGHRDIDSFSPPAVWRPIPTRVGNRVVVVCTNNWYILGGD